MNCLKHSQWKKFILNMGHVVVVKSIQQMYLDHIVKFKAVSELNTGSKWQFLITRKSKEFLVETVIFWNAKCS